MMRMSCKRGETTGRLALGPALAADLPWPRRWPEDMPKIAEDDLLGLLAKVASQLSAPPKARHPHLGIVRCHRRDGKPVECDV